MGNCGEWTDASERAGRCPKCWKAMLAAERAEDRIRVQHLREYAAAGGVMALEEAQRITDEWAATARGDLSYAHSQPHVPGFDAGAFYRWRKQTGRIPTRERRSGS